MNKEEFNSLNIASQVFTVNDFISKFGSLRSACSQIGINKSTVQSRFKKDGYVFDNNKYVLYGVSSQHKENIKSLGLDNMVENIPNSLEITQESYENMSYLDKCGFLSKYKIAVQRCVNSIANSFVEIGKLLTQINKYELYKVANCDSVFEYAYLNFNIKKSTVYNLMAVYNRFGSSGALQDSYKNFSYSQLSEMVNLPKEIIDDIKNTDSVRDIKKKKKSLKEGPKINEEEIPGQISVLNPVDDDITVVLKRSEIVDLLFFVDKNSNLTFETAVLDKLKKAICE